VREVAVAGPRIAWIVNEGGNTYLGVGRANDRGAVVFLPMSSLR
jgi:hypothetical protein